MGADEGKHFTTRLRADTVSQGMCGKELMFEYAHEKLQTTQDRSPSSAQPILSTTGRIVRPRKSLKRSKTIGLIRKTRPIRRPGRRCCLRKLRQGLGISTFPNIIFLFLPGNRLPNRLPWRPPPCSLLQLPRLRRLQLGAVRRRLLGMIEQTPSSS